MESIGTVLYDYGDGLYVNLTNKCPCRCSFCVREQMDGVGDADSLWLKREPTEEEVKTMLAKRDLSACRELVFCGYGEPTERLDVLLSVARYAKEKRSDLPIRINTNGLADLLYGRDTTGDLKGLIDTVSISLNASNAKSYAELCHPQFGERAFDAILDYAFRAKKVVPEVVFSVVGFSLSEEEIAICRGIARHLGVAFRVREAETGNR
ncbi:TIGR04100 family radical SAM protein [Murdochiella sp. Marseille-P8839]|nr:TIGR04100 family radical SAM protein [Murdochiella sp. Marseille-P8839]